MHRTRNAAYGQPYRGFESLPLRHIILKTLHFLTILPLQPSACRAQQQAAGIAVHAMNQWQ
jgi:hypothetical protein